jgi:hypothetical protein
MLTREGGHFYLAGCAPGLTFPKPLPGLGFKAPICYLTRMGGEPSESPLARFATAPARISQS